MQALRVALAQINARVGDISGNAALIRRYAGQALEAGADVVCFPELALTGYPPEDLLLRRSFVDDNLAAIRDLASEIRGLTAVVGFVDADDDIYNAAAVIHDGVRNSTSAYSSGVSTRLRPLVSFDRRRIV